MCCWPAGAAANNGGTGPNDDELAEVAVWTDLEACLPACLLAYLFACVLACLPPSPGSGVDMLPVQ